MISYLKKISGSLLLPVVIFQSCTTDDGIGVGVPTADAQWLVPVSQIFDGGPGKDGIPSIDNPTFVSISETGDRIRDFELVTGIIREGRVKLYPHSILDYHEIVNDELSDILYALNYCPLTGTSYAWDRAINGSETTFGVSGLLYQNNLIPYDRSTENYYSQMLCQSIQGSQVGDSTKHFDVVEMRWSAWKSGFPEAQVLSFDTGFDRPYGDYPYGNYRTEEALLFPQSNIDDRLFAKERVLFVKIGTDKKVYPFPSDQTGFFSFSDSIGVHRIVVVGDVSQGSIRAFLSKSEEGIGIEFTGSGAVDGTFEDQKGDQWDVFGRKVSDPTSQDILRIPDQTVGYWFAIAAFNPRVAIY